MRGARRPRRPFLLATLVSIAAHLIVLGLLVPNSPVPRAPPERAFEVELLPPPKAGPTPEERARPLASTSSSARAPIRSEAPAVVSPADGLANLHQPPEAPGPSAFPSEPGGGGGQVLSLEGCDPRRLASARERRDCDVRQMAMARLRPPPQVEDDLTKGGRFEPPDPLPYLARQPKKGCKPKTGGGQGMDTQDIPVLGIACVFHF
jgi:hypothetical protein